MAEQINSIRRKVHHLPQSHHHPIKTYDKVKPEHRKDIILSQYSIAKILCEASFDLPSDKSRYHAVIRQKGGAIPVFLESVERDIPPVEFYEVRQRKPEVIAKVKRLFPGRKMPASFKALTDAQKRFLYRHGATETAMLLGKAIDVKAVTDRATNNKFKSVVMHYGRKYGWLDPAGLRLGCLVFANNDYRRWMMDAREQAALVHLTAYFSDPKNTKTPYLIYGAAHIFSAYKSSGIKFEVPKEYRPVHRELISIVVTRQDCVALGKKLASLLPRYVDDPKRSSQKQVNIVAQRLVLQFLNEGRLRTLGFKELFSIIDPSLYELARPVISPDKVAGEFTSAIFSSLAYIAGVFVDTMSFN